MAATHHNYHGPVCKFAHEPYKSWQRTHARAVRGIRERGGEGVMGSCLSGSDDDGGQGAAPQGASKEPNRGVAAYENTVSPTPSPAFIPTCNVLFQDMLALRLVIDEHTNALAVEMCIA